MKVLFDTNILIHREDPKIVPQNLQKLERTIRENGDTILIHPASIKDIEKDKDEARKQIFLSKISSYPQILLPPVPDQTFLNILGSDILKKGITNDDCILYAVYRNAVDILVTEDKGIHKKAHKLGITKIIMDIVTALEYFSSLYQKAPLEHPIIHEEPTYNIDINDPFFDSIKRDYPLDTWFPKIQKEGRMCWVLKDDDSRIKAILIYKEEDETIELVKPKTIIERKKRFKISTLKVEAQGLRIGELLLKLSIKHCVLKNIDEIYLTHFLEPNDLLAKLVEECGFECLGDKDNKNSLGEYEKVYLKKLLPENPRVTNPLMMSRRFYPSFKDGNDVRKFIVPIRPEYHDRLFQDYIDKQRKITEYTSIDPEFGMRINPQGNTIKKAYLTKSPIKKIRGGDILLFYRSQDNKKITSMGVVDTIYYSISNPTSIWNFVNRNRSVYSPEEIKNLKKPQTVIVFRHHFDLNNPLSLKELMRDNVIKSWPQSIIEITDDKYQYIKNKGGINERFAFN